jgi:hypothetical protein
MDILKHALCEQQKERQWTWSPISGMATSGDKLRPKLEAFFEKTTRNSGYLVDCYPETGHKNAWNVSSVKYQQNISKNM